MLTDTAMIREIKAGNVRCYEDLVRRYEQTIYIFVYRILLSSGLERRTEDICQEIFCNVYRYIHLFSGEHSSFKSWLYAVARNQTFSELRKRHNSEVVVNDEQFLTYKGADSIESELLRQERIAMVREAITRLPDKQRQAIYLQMYKDKNYKEIAKTLGLTVPNVKTILFRARNTLKVHLEEYIRYGT